MESFPSENKMGEALGYHVGDSSSKQGLIVIHEWWGQNDQIKQQGADFANDGNLQVLVPDLYRGKIAEDNETAGHLMNNLDWEGAIQDISAAAKFLKSKGCVKVGVTGFCMGGALAFASAALIPSDVSAAAPFYGIPSTKLCDLTTIKIPVQCHFGKKDEIEGFSSKKDYDPVREKLEKAGVNMEFYEYDCGHAFCNPANRIGENYNAEAAKLATSRMFVFMNKNLQ